MIPEPPPERQAAPGWQPASPLRPEDAALQRQAEQRAAVSFEDEIDAARGYERRLPLKALAVIALVAAIVMARLLWLA
ncbi:MAG: hypothetical protein ACLPUO_20010 [Streptosporangiaceae bacterium]|jgi:hypothetical protein